MRKNLRGTQLIRLDPIAKGFMIFGVFLFFLIFIFALDYLDIFLALAALGWLTMIIMGYFLSRFLKTPKAIGDKRAYGMIGVFVMIALLAFIALDTWAPRIIPVSLSTIPGSNVLTITVLSVILAGIAEEVLFRFGATNVFAVLGKSVYSAIVASGAFFAIYHIAVYPNLSTLVIVGASGSILALVDFLTQRLSTSIIAHTSNNLLAVAYSVFVVHNLNLIAPAAIIAAHGAGF